MLNLGFTEILVVVVLAIVVVGPDKLPTMVKFMGRQYGKLMRASEELRRAFMLEADRADAEERAKELRTRREAARKRAEAARKRALEAAEARNEGDPNAPAPTPVARAASSDPTVPAESPAPSESPDPALPEPAPVARPEPAQGDEP